MQPELFCERRKRRLRSDARGFSLTELMITLSVMAVLMGIVAPSLQDFVLSSKLSTQANNLVSSVLLSRGEAIKRNAAVTLCVSDNGSTCNTSGGWERGWIVISGTTVIQRQQSSPTGIKITEAAGLVSISFDPTGVGATQTSLKVCRNSPTAGSQERVVTVSATGRPTVTKTTTAVCT